MRRTTKNTALSIFGNASQKQGRHRARDRTLLLIMFRDGLRVGDVELLKSDALMLNEQAIAGF
ncbi:hypothetical protein [Trichocoleus sp. FACHB-262]|uniref:hypothetical protein n=1 Tax=Trichocoleus sp. FACHB-262 TaxID=2692869 RepID=UPI001686495E|nr:hypothetical protein [Trichocoleus sp. FACHB-262]MBD2122205.1 hypothetical protein [Trichocoleus sp. FACHB-262]